MGNLLSKQAPQVANSLVVDRSGSEKTKWSEKPPKALKEMGPGLKCEFMFADGWRNLNHGGASLLLLLTGHVIGC
jgi:hypothetical protein